MKTKSIILVAITLIIFIAGCAKKEKPNAKFVGSYQTSDTWGSSKDELGSGTLEYVMTIIADGEDGIIIDNVNKTLHGIKAKVSNDSFYVEKQTANSTRGNTYKVTEGSGTLTGNTLKFSFGYNDVESGNAIGYIFCRINGKKDTVQSK
jgi:hypothetical protein